MLLKDLLQLEAENEDENKPDILKIDIPLFIRLLEYAREEASTDVQLHELTENAIKLSENGKVLNMDNYEELIPKKKTEDSEM